MFTEVLKIIPNISSSDLTKMERQLSTRFGNVAKKFGKGMLNVLKGGGIAGIAFGLIDKLLNPLKETQEAIDRTLKHSDDVVTNAKQFGTTPGSLLKLQKLAKSTGLPEESLNILLTKFSTAVAEAQADKTKDTSVRSFVNDKDMANAFFNFIQSLQRMDPKAQLRVQTEVFGEKQILKMAQFLQTDFAKQVQFTGLDKFSTEKVDSALEKTANLNNLKEALEVNREVKDLIKKATLMNEGMVRTMDASAKLELNRENDRIAQFQSLSKISDASTKIVSMLEQLLTYVAKLVDKVTGLTEAIKGFSVSSTWRKLWGTKE